MEEAAEPEVDRERFGYSSHEVRAIAGVSYRQIDYWTRTDLIAPSLEPGKGSGSRRRFSESDLRKLKLIKAMLDAGMTLRTVRFTINFIGTDLSEGQIIAIKEGGDVYLYHSTSEFRIDGRLKSGQWAWVYLV